jgi:hypothetical protein
VLDSLQSDFFSEAMHDPELRAAMPPGFTYYRNATSVYSRTHDSLRSIFTSRMLNGRNRVVPKALSLPTRLAEHGFDAVAITFNDRFVGPRDWDYRYVTSATVAGAGSASAAWREDVSDMFALGTFRLSPHFLKRRIYDDGQWRTPRLYPQRNAVSRDPKIDHRTRMDLAVFDELISAASAGNTAPQFRFLHFFGPHRPFTVDKKCGHLSNGSTRKRAVAVTHCILSRVYEFLHKLDEIGAYDRSLIFVVADHGSYIVPLEVSTAIPRIPENVEPNDAVRANDATLVDWHGRAVPVFLAKSFGDRHALRISDVPVSLCDIPKSVMDKLAIESDFECESVFSVGTPRQAPRIIHFRGEHATFGQTRLGLPPKYAAAKFLKFKVVGHSWLSESWGHFVVDAE